MVLLNNREKILGELFKSFPFRGFTVIRSNLDQGLRNPCSTSSPSCSSPKKSSLANPPELNQVIVSKGVKKIHIVLRGFKVKFIPLKRNLQQRS